MGRRDGLGRGRRAARPPRRADRHTMAAAVGGALLGPAVGALAAAVGVTPVFCGVAVVGVALAAWALATPPAAPEGISTPRELLAALRDGRVAGGIWLIARARADVRHDRGAGAAAARRPRRRRDRDRRRVAGRRRARGGRQPGRRPAVGPPRAAVPEPDRARRRRHAACCCSRGPSTAWQLGLLVLLAAPLVGMLWAPSMAMLSDGAEALGIAQGLAFALSNLGWSTGQSLGNAGSARLADATSDAVPYLILAAIALATFAVLRARPGRRPPSALAWRPAMGARVIDGKAIAQQVRAEVAAEVAAWVGEGHAAPGLATVLVGDDPASAVYVGGKQKATHEVGMRRLRPPAAGRHAAGRRRGAARRARRRPARLGHPAPAPDAGAHRRRRDDRPDRPGQGRRRADAGLGRPARPGPARAAAVHARRA